MNQNTEQVSQNKGLNEFERAKIYYTKKVADNLLHIANPGNKVETPYKSGAKLEKMGISKDDYKQSIVQNSRNFCAYSGTPYNNVNDFNLDLEKAIHNYNSSAWIWLSDAAIKLEIGKLANEEPQKANELRNALREIKNNEPCNFTKMTANALYKPRAIKVMVWGKLRPSKLKSCFVGWII